MSVTCDPVRLSPLLLLLLGALLGGRLLPDVSASAEKRTSAFVNGDCIVGALLPIHLQPRSRQRGQGLSCGRIREHYGVQRVEVAFQTLDRINADPAVLPGLTLGLEIRDECWYAPVALQQSIELVRDALAPAAPLACRSDDDDADAGDEGEGQRRGPLIGVVGPGSSSVALQVQNLLQLFHMPQVGYSTTSRDLSDKSRFSYFLRVVPSDYYQAQVMLDIVRHYGWTYVSAVNTDENYGQSGIQAFRELAEQADVCIAREDSVLSSAADAVFDKVILNLRQDPSATVVVCFCEGFTVRGLLRATRRLNITNHFLFIGSDGWADRKEVTEGYEEEAWGGLSVRIHSSYIHSFDSYYLGLKPQTNLRNPWFKEFWEAKFKCVFQDPYALNAPRQLHGDNGVNTTKKICTGEEDLSADYRQDAKLSFVMKAIYSLAHALHDMRQDLCGPAVSGLCDKLLPFNGSLFKSYLLNVSFELGGEWTWFDENGDPPGRYDLMNFQRMADGSYDYVQVGSWDKGTLLWHNGTPVQFGRRSVAPTSVCSEPCPPGHYKNIQQGGKDKRCCWVCVPCPAGAILDEGGDSCTPCPKGYEPDDLKAVCLLLPLVYVQWSDTQAIVSMLFACVGFLTTGGAVAVFARHNDTPVVKSSTRELSYIILAGMTLSHVSVFAILAKPTPASCALARTLPPLSFAMMYAALLTKTNRIARILAGSKKRFPTRHPPLMSAGAQLWITAAMVGAEALVAVAMLRRQPPGARRSFRPRRTVLECDASPEAVAAPLSFDFFLVAMCTVYAVKTRNVPENFNEAKFIGFAMYTTCVIWLAFVPIYFGSDSKVVALCMCVTLSAMVTWVFLFLPKLYIILFRPEKNNRALFTTSKSLRCHIGSRVATALSEKSSTNSWRDSSGVAEGQGQGPGYKEGMYRPPQRSLSCQTGRELLQVLLLDPAALLPAPSQAAEAAPGPRITERDCCDSCHMKNITIQLPPVPDNPTRPNGTRSHQTNTN